LLVETQQHHSRHEYFTAPTPTPATKAASRFWWDWTKTPIELRERNVVLNEAELAWA
jgi:hypothetical protein